MKWNQAWRVCKRASVGALAVAGLSFGASALVSAPADATIVVKHDVDGLTTGAETIVMGRVRAQSARWVGTRIMTEVQIEVALPVMGKADVGEVVTVEVLGGRVGDLAQVVSGVSRFSEGEDVVLFLKRSVAQPQVSRVVGMAQGKYTVVQGPDERLWAVRDLNGLTLAEVVPGSAGPRHVTRFAHMAPEELGAVPLDGLMRQVATGMRRLDEPVRPELLRHLGQGLRQQVDFSKVFEALDVSPRRGEP